MGLEGAGNWDLGEQGIGAGGREFGTGGPRNWGWGLTGVPEANVPLPAAGQGGAGTPRRLRLGLAAATRSLNSVLLKTSSASNPPSL